MKKYIVILILIIFLPNLVDFTFGRDGAVFAYMGSLLCKGKIPYIDGFDHKGISIYLINAFGYLIGFKNLIGIRILELGLMIASFLSLYKSIVINYSKKVAGTAIIFGLLTLKYFFDDGNLTEEYGAYFVLIALALVLKTKQNKLDYLIIGFLFVINFTIRANLIAFWPALFLALLITPLTNKNNIKTFKNQFIKMVFGALIAIGSLTIYFLVTHSFSNFYQDAFVYNFSYAKQSVSEIILSIISSTRRYEVSIIMILAFVISIVSFIKQRAVFLELLLIFWIPLELYLSNMSGKLFAHYYIMWMPLIIISVVVIFNYFKEVYLSNEQLIVIMIITVFLCFQIPIFMTLTSYKNMFSNNQTNTQKTVNYINDKYKDSSILVWGNETAIYNLTNKRATIPYFFQTFFKLESPQTKMMIEDFTNKIIAHSPDVIIDVKTSSLLFLDLSNQAIIEQNQKENLEPYFKFVNENYYLAESKFDADYYVRN